MTSNQLKPTFNFFWTSESNDMQMHVFGTIDCSKIPLPAHFSGEDSPKVVPCTLTSGLSSPFDWFFAFFSDKNSVEAALD